MDMAKSPAAAMAATTTCTRSLSLSFTLFSLCDAPRRNNHDGGASSNLNAKKDTAKTSALKPRFFVGRCVAQAASL